MKGPKTIVGPSEGSASPKKFYPTNIKNIVSEKKKEIIPNKTQKQFELIRSESTACRCIKLEDSGCSIYMSTPMVIKWSINHLFFTSSIYRLVWNFKDVEIISVVSRIGNIHFLMPKLIILASHYYKVGDTIEIEVEVENKSQNDLQLELIPPSEVLLQLSNQAEVIFHFFFFF